MTLRFYRVNRARHRQLEYTDNSTAKVLFPFSVSVTFKYSDLKETSNIVCRSISSGKDLHSWDLIVPKDKTDLNDTTANTGVKQKNRNV